MNKLIIIHLALLSLAFSGCAVSTSDTTSNHGKPQAEKAFTDSLFGLSKNENKLKSIEVDGKSYRYYLYQVANPKQVIAGVNNNVATVSSKLRDMYQCKFLINGGFYQTDNKPIGLVENRGEVLNEIQPNQILNGILGVDSESQPFIDMGQLYKRKNNLFAIQSGPILFDAERVAKLQVSRDEPARRMVGAVTKDNKLVFMVVTSKESMFKGPLLVDLPVLVDKIGVTEQLDLVSAINLDGGTASTFLTDTVELQELKNIGSFLCEQ